MSCGGIHYNYLSVIESHVLQNNMAYPEEIFIVLYLTFMFAVYIIHKHGTFFGYVGQLETNQRSRCVAHQKKDKNGVDWR